MPWPWKSVRKTHPEHAVEGILANPNLSNLDETINAVVGSIADCSQPLPLVRAQNRLRLFLSSKFAEIGGLTALSSAFAVAGPGLLSAAMFNVTKGNIKKIKANELFHKRDIPQAQKVADKIAAVLTANASILAASMSAQAAISIITNAIKIANPAVGAATAFSISTMAWIRMSQDISALKRAKLKSDPAYLAEDRALKAKRMTKEIEGLEVKGEAKTAKLETDRQRMEIQRDALLVDTITPGVATTTQRALKDFIMKKQLKKVSLIKQSILKWAAIGTGTLNLGAAGVSAIFFPALAPKFAIAGASSLAVGIGLKAYDRRDSYGWKHFGLKSPARRRFEKGFSHYCELYADEAISYVETDSGDKEPLTVTDYLKHIDDNIFRIAELENDKTIPKKERKTQIQKLSKENQNASNQLIEFIEIMLVRKRFHLEPTINTHKFISPTSHRRVASQAYKAFARRSNSVLPLNADSPSAESSTTFHSVSLEDPLSAAASPTSDADPVSSRSTSSTASTPQLGEEGSSTPEDNGAGTGLFSR